MLLEADGHTFSSTGESPELVQGALIGWDLSRQAVVLVADEVIEGFRSVFVDQF